MLELWDCRGISVLSASADKHWLVKCWDWRATVNIQYMSADQLSVKMSLGWNTVVDLWPWFCRQCSYWKCINTVSLDSENMVNKLLYCHFDRSMVRCFLCFEPCKFQPQPSHDNPILQRVKCLFVKVNWSGGMGHGLSLRLSQIKAFPLVFIQHSAWGLRNQLRMYTV